MREGISKKVKEKIKERKIDRKKIDKENSSKNRLMGISKP